MKNGNIKLSARRVVGIGAFVFVLFLAHGISMGEVLKATPDQFDFGTLGEGSLAVITVVVENVTSTPVEITNVRTS